MEMATNYLVANQKNSARGTSTFLELTVFLCEKPCLCSLKYSENMQSGSDVPASLSHCSTLLRLKTTLLLSIWQ